MKFYIRTKLDPKVIMEANNNICRNPALKPHQSLLNKDKPVTAPDAAVKHMYRTGLLFHVSIPQIHYTNSTHYNTIMIINLFTFKQYMYFKYFFFPLTCNFVFWNSFAGVWGRGRKGRLKGNPLIYILDKLK